MARKLRVLTVPNLITVSRMALLVPVVKGILAPEPKHSTFTLTALWASTDWVDGWFARRFDQQSRLGEIIDPIADRTGIAAVATALTASGSLPAVATATIAGTDVVAALGAGKAALEGRIHVSKVGKLRSLVMFVGMTALVAERSGYPELGKFGRATTLVGVVLHVYCGAKYVVDAFRTRPRRQRAVRG
ncbi:CDP-alcohol phosphatidyltransferase family protein [Gulosibacter molinativorax]|uniref:CDP-alcohol phosphatidyltransferase family protein n=1 Tax=Gulosibacter molinativorax TaxID=256821 RepID=A0ABT7C587_9MICO|nr:CDP-alcohol phosphatidyltransferase family protein [Gulosibacter molinativorax]MDJ1370354.1 CDP-alcohol phosphatidyltransferase family protein [Gulosibacter molinativorax]QUY61267.1 CDP-diacylglycerol-glycerol-3-phosphate 3-phosphatidyltransferase [Gulosibacter molinativorax]